MNVMPFGTIPDRKARNSQRIKRWDVAGKMIKVCLVSVWILKLLICVLFIFACAFSGAIVLTPIPLFLGLNVFTAPPFGVRSDDGANDAK